jgi:hypothetical protein
VDRGLLDFLCSNKDQGTGYLTLQLITLSEESSHEEGRVKFMYGLWFVPLEWQEHYKAKNVQWQVEMITASRFPACPDLNRSRGLVLTG